MRSASFLLLIATFVFAAALPAAAQQSHGYGSIYLSPSGHRIGWAKSLGSEGSADDVARHWCQGGQLDGQAAQAYRDNEGGAAATATAWTSLATPVGDCFKVIKFASNVGHRCAGFGFNPDGRYSRGVRKANRSDVQSALSSWQQTFVICNDDQAVSGTERFLNGLSKFASALNDLVGGNGSSKAPSSAAVASNAPGPIVFRNDTSLRVPYRVKCSTDADSAYHTLSIDPGQTQTVDPTVWGSPPCSAFVVAIESQANDGSTSSFTNTFSPGGPYSIYVNSAGGAIEAGGTSTSAADGITVVNDATKPLFFYLSCPGTTPTKMTLASGNRASYPLGCSSGTLDLPTKALTKHYPVIPGQTYHLHWDSAAGIYVLTRG
jgi:hypothetical protein